MGSNSDIALAAQAYLEKNLTQTTQESKEEPVGQTQEEPTEEQEVEEGQSTQEAEEQQDLIELKAAGESRKYTLDELKELASKGFDYTRKTQELSERVKTETEKEVNQRTAALEAEKKRLLDATDMIESFYGKPFVTPEQLDELINSGQSDEYLRLSRQEEKRKEILAQARSERNKITETEAKAKEEQLKQAAIQHTQMLFEKMPELKQEENQKKLANYLSKSGLSNEEIQNFVDHRGLMIAEKARRYDELKNGKLEPEKKDPPKVIRKVGSSVNKQTYTEKDLQVARDRLIQTGHLRDAAALYLKAKQK